MYTQKTKSESFFLHFHVFYPPCTKPCGKRERKKKMKSIKNTVDFHSKKGNGMKKHCTQYITSVNYVMLHYIEDKIRGKIT